MTIKTLTVAALVASSACAFTAPIGAVSRRPVASQQLHVVADVLTEQAAITAAAPTLLAVKEADPKELLKAVLITLSFGGGLIPALISGNKQMISTLTGKRRGGEDASEKSDSATNLDPTLEDVGNRVYIESSGASGPTLPGSSLLFPNEDIPLVDIIAIMGRIESLNSIADWKNLPSTKLQNVSENPPMWLPRGAFKSNVRKLPFKKWPIDPKTGEPIGGAALQAAEEGRIKGNSADTIGDAALDAVWDTWAWGASIATPDKVQKCLNDYHSSVDTFSVNKFVRAALFGRSLTGLAALTFIVIQISVFGSLFIAPGLRYFLNIDIGFGELGYCDPETCISLVR